MAKWVAARGGIGGLHHFAYQVESVEETIKEWEKKGWADFSSDPIVCDEDDLTQVFSVPHKLTGFIYEFIERRGNVGFCKSSVKNLMESSKENK